MWRPCVKALTFTTFCALSATGCASTSGAATDAPPPTTAKSDEAAKPAPATKKSESGTKTPVEKSHPPTTSPILFAYDSAILTDDGKRALDDIATYLESDAGARMTIEGHADERGSDAYNLSLGQQRADAIARYLRQKGVREERLKSVSYGEHRPAVDGRGESVWSKNRRGELKVGADGRGSASSS